MEPRELELPSLDAVVEEAKRLHSQGYQQIGDWDLSQILQHVSVPLKMGTGEVKIKANPLMRIMVTLFAKKKFFRERKIKPGLPAPGPTVFPSIDEGEAVRQFEQAVATFKNFDGPWPKHPFFGKLTPQQWHDFNTIHCCHHLGFLIPKDG